MNEKHIGSDFEDFLREEGLLEESINPMSTILLIIPPERFRDEELFVTRCQGAA